MKNCYCFTFIMTLIILISSCTSKQEHNAQLNIDPVKVSPGKFKIVMKNEHIRLVQYSLRPGENDNWHTHPPKSSYVLSGGKLKVFLENGETIMADEKTGTASWMDYVGKHYVENIGAQRLLFY